MKEFPRQWMINKLYGNYKRKYYGAAIHQIGFVKHTRDQESIYCANAGSKRKYYSAAIHQNGYVKLKRD